MNFNLQQENEFILNTLLKSPKNSVFLDVGAHNGSTCLPIAKELKNNNRNDIRIIAFEPNQKLSNEINKKSNENKLNIKCINIVVSDSKSTVFKKSDEGSGTMYDTIFEGEEFKSNTLDNLLDELNIKSVFFLKVDVEGHEPKLLKGATKILKNTSHLYIEIWSNKHYETRSNKKGVSYNKNILSHLNDFYPIQKYEKNYYFKHKNLLN